MISLNLSSTTRLGLNLLALLGGVMALSLGYQIFIPTIIALFLAALLWPYVRGLHQVLRVPWTLACLIGVMGLVLINFLMTLGLYLAVFKIVQDLPTPERQQEIYEEFRAHLEKTISPLPLDEDYFPKVATQSRVFQYIKEQQNTYIKEVVFNTFYYGNLWFWQWVLIMFILLFLLIEGPMLSRRVVEIFGPSEQAQAYAVRALADMANHVRTYLVWRTIINFGLAILLGLAYKWFGLKQAWTWAMLTAILCYIPYLGPIAAGVFPVVEAFVSLSPLSALEILGFYIVIFTVEGYVLIPVVMGRTMELNATTVLLACMFWEVVWGLPGLFLAMPLMAAVKAICTNVPTLRPWANLMSTRRYELRPVTSEEEDMGMSAEEKQRLVAEAKAMKDS